MSAKKLKLTEEQFKNTYVDLLEVDLLAEQSVLWLFQDFYAEGNERRLDNISPEATHHDLVSVFVFLSHSPQL